MSDLDSLVGALDALLPTQKRACLELIQKAVRNVSDNPREEKFRRLKKSNAKVAASIAKYPQAAALLAYCGWSNTPDAFVCAPPSQQLLTQMRETLDILDALLSTEDVQPESSVPDSTTSSQGIIASAAQSTSASAHASQQRASTPPKNAASKNSPPVNCGFLNPHTSHYP